jgi:integrase
MSVLILSRPGRKPWFYKFIWRGKQIRKFGFETQALALAAENAKRKELELLGDSDTFAMLVAQRLAELEVYGTRLWLVNSRGILEQYKCWADLPVSGITGAMVRAKILEVAREQTNSIANRHLVVLKSCFNVAVRDGKLLVNPANNIKLLPIEKNRKQIPTKDEIEAVISAAKPLDAAYLTVIWLTAARVGEISRLQWGDVDLGRHRLTLWTRKKAGGNLKPRNVFTIGRVEDAIRLAHDCMTPGSPWVFTNPEMARQYPGEPERWRYIYRDKFLKTLCARLGIKPFGYHALRHHTASALDQLGVPLVAIQNILGHDRASTTDGYLQDLGRVGTGLSALEERANVGEI